MRAKGRAACGVYKDQAKEARTNGLAGGGRRDGINADGAHGVFVGGEPHLIRNDCNALIGK